MRLRTLLKAGVAATALPSTFAIAQSNNGAGTNKLLRYVPPADLSVLDPSWTTTQVSITHGYYVFDTLFAINSEQKPQLQMAESANVSEDGRTWDIKLRDGLLFHDGEKVLARDCAASLARTTRGRAREHSTQPAPAPSAGSTPATARAVVEAAYFERRSVDEIARNCGLPEPEVRRLLRQGMDDLKRQFSPSRNP